MKKQFTLLLVILISAFSMNATIYVNLNATGANNGTSWTDAYINLQVALADPNVTTEEIWVVAGTYLPTTTADRAISFNIPDGANVYGGFIGTETTLSERNYEANSTILSGAIGAGTPADNTYHVVTLIDVGNTTVLDGFIIRDGYAFADGDVEEDNGGGIYIHSDAADCEPNINNCKINANLADYYGGGIYVRGTGGIYSCNPIIYNCQISNNTSNNYGGGLVIRGSRGAASPIVRNCLISGNSASSEGGGVVTEGNDADGICNAEFICCVISGNESDLGGGMGIWGGDVAGGVNGTVLRNCTFTGNIGTSGGGAFENYSGSSTCVATLYNCLVWGNSSIMYNWDGADPSYTYYYCDIEGSSTWDTGIGIDGGNNIDANPYFSASILPTKTIAGDFRNHFASLAIGAGDATEAPANDINGDPFSTPPSMGAYEYAALPGDWDGTTDSDWGTSTNWLTGVVATAADDVYLSNKAINDPLVNEAGATPAECNNLKLLAGTTLFIEPLAGLTVHGNLVIDPAATFGINSDVNDIGSLITLETVSGEIGTERYIGESEWHLISSPVVGETANIFYGNYLQTYDETTQTWTDIEDETTVLSPMIGYAMWGTTAPETYYTFIGEPGTGNNPIGFTFNTDGWNLLGNPFPSSIDWDLVTLPTEINGAVYYLDATAGNYVSYNGGMGGGTQYVPPMQGFWISATATGTFSVGNSVRTHLGTDEYYKNGKEISNYIVLQVQSEDMVDKTYIRLNEEATPAFDGKYDAYKLMAPNKIYPQIYTIAGEDNLSISQLPATDVISVGFYVENSGNYTISLDEITDIQSCQLEDLKTGTLQNLENGSYTFSYTEGENDDRFRLHLTAASVNFSGAEEGVKMYAVGQEVFVKSANPIEKGTVRVTDLAGRTMVEKTISNESFIRLTTNLSIGVYIVSVTESAGVRTEKVIIN